MAKIFFGFESSLASQHALCYASRLLPVCKTSKKKLKVMWEQKNALFRILQNSGLGMLNLYLGFSHDPFIGPLTSAERAAFTVLLSGLEL